MMTNKPLQLSRRECLLGTLALAVPTGLTAHSSKTGEEHQLRNESLKFCFTLAQGGVTARRLLNKLANETVDLPNTEFSFEFSGGAVADSTQFSARVTAASPERLEITYSGHSEPFTDLQVRAEYSLLPAQAYVRKQLSIRQTRPGSTRRLLRADLDSWQGVNRDWQSPTADRMRYGSHPIFCRTLWAGVEFIAACNEFSSQGFVLRSRPGGKTLTSEWLRLHSTVAGVAAPGRTKEAFFHYLEEVRLSPPRLVACYNSWWSLPEICSEEICLPLIRRLVKDLYDKHAVFFDFVAVDMGWSDPHSIWGVNRAHFPTGLAGLVDCLRPAGAKLGLWISPSEVYAPVMDYQWAAQNGYAVVEASHDPLDYHATGLSLADPKYLLAAQNEMQALITQNGVGHIKFDGFIALEQRAHHQLLPGDDSVEPLAEGSLELIKACKQADPDLFTEPTYLNALANYSSPWMIKYVDSTWAGAGDDCIVGIGPSPDYRESQTNSREFFVVSALDEIWLPQNAMQSFDIVHCDGAGGFPNHAAMAFARGRFFVSTYINPKFMADADWEIYAGLLKWGRRNQEVLRNTTVLASRVELGEPYAYAHWSGRRGIVAVRNPSNDSKNFTLDLAQAGCPAQLSAAVCYTQYPYRRGIAEGVTAGSKIALDLAPWELLFLEIVPRSELLEPVALGARWYRETSGRMSVADSAGPVRLLLPHGCQRAVDMPTGERAHPQATVVSQRIDGFPKSDWLHHGGTPLETSAFEIECSVSIPDAAVAGKALLLLEFPGHDQLAHNCWCEVDGRSVPLQVTSSTGHVGYIGGGPETARKRLEPYFSQWTWYICDLPKGRARVKFSGIAADERSKLGLWVWTDWDLAGRAVPVSVECPEPALPPYQQHLKRHGVCVLPPRLLRDITSTG
jgi:hypothetical protein